MDIYVDKSSDLPIYLQVYNKLKQMIEDEQLVGDMKLPPIRKLASQLHVNNTTIVSAYQKLTEEGLTYKVRGSGCFVAPKAEKLLAEISEFENAENYLPIKHTLFQSNKDAINFATATPKASQFPVTDFKKALNAVLDRDMGEAFGYQEVKGYLPLRESIREYVLQQGITTETEQMQIISGAQQGLDIVSKSILNINDVVIVEAPTYSGAIATFRSRGVKIIQIPIGIDGINIKKLEAIIKREKPKLFYTMTNCQNPTGYTYSQACKKALLELSERYSFYIVEDDFASELLYKQKGNSALKAMDHSDRVIYIKSFSKILMPGLRLGFMIVPNLLNQGITNAKQATDISTSGLTQRAFDMYLRTGKWEKQMLLMKKSYYKRFKKMIDCLNQYMPRFVKFYVPKGGILFWIELPRSVDSKKFAEYVNQSGILIVAGEMFLYREKSHAFRLSIAAVNENEIEEGIQSLSQLIKEYIKKIEA